MAYYPADNCTISLSAFLLNLVEFLGSGVYESSEACL